MATETTSSRSVKPGWAFISVADKTRTGDGTAAAASVQLMVTSVFLKLASPLGAAAVSVAAPFVRLESPKRFQPVGRLPTVVASKFSVTPPIETSS